jgi:hypothetical protein
LSQALLLSGSALQRSDMVSAGLRSLEWLLTLQTSDAKQFSAIGSNGFYARDAGRATFDQQPVEAGATASACVDAYRVTGDPRWAARGRWVFNWFLGENHLQHWLFEPSTGACCDGLHADRPNLNQGAEATLSCLLALGEIRSISALQVHGASMRDLQLTS